MPQTYFLKINNLLKYIDIRCHLGCIYVSLIERFFAINVSDAFYLDHIFNFLFLSMYMMLFDILSLEYTVCYTFFD